MAPFRGGAGPDVVHALHARRGGACALPLARRAQVPCVITLTVTDVTHDLHRPELAASVRSTLAGAAAVVALRASQLDELREASVIVPRHTLVIPQGISLAPAQPGGHGDLRARLGLGPRQAAALALLPGGLRPVKAQHVALCAFEQLRAAGAPELHLALAGPVLDEEYAALLRERAEGCPGVHFVGTLAQPEMGTALASADVVLNTSESEGESNALLEAQAAGRPVIARRNRGNAALIDDGVDGWLFDTPEELAARLVWWRAHPEGAAKVAAAARARVAPRLEPGREARAHAQLYRALLAQPKRTE